MPKLAVPLLILMQLLLLVGALADALLHESPQQRHLLIILSHGLLMMLTIWALQRSSGRESRTQANLNRQLQVALRRAQDLIEASTNLVWEIDVDGRFTFVSDHHGIMTGVEGVRIATGAYVADVAAADPVTPAEVWRQQIAENAAGLAMRDFRYSLRKCDGSIAHFRVNGVPIRSDDGTLTGFRGTTRDETVEIQALDTLNYQALHDWLTGLPNRRALHLALDRAVAGPTSHSAVLLLDLDGFKMINDLHGHAAGDMLLQLVAKRLAASTRDTDTAARLGGDEFGIVIMDVDETQAAETVRRLITTLSQPYLLDERVIVTIGISIGIAHIPGHGTDPDMLLRHADRMLYQMKHTGGGASAFTQIDADDTGHLLRCGTSAMDRR